MKKLFLPIMVMFLSACNDYTSGIYDKLLSYLPWGTHVCEKVGSSDNAFENKKYWDSCRDKANEGNPEDQYYFAKLLFRSELDEEGEGYLHASAEQGYAPSMILLGHREDDNYNKLEWFQEACDYKNSEGCELAKQVQQEIDKQEAEFKAEQERLRQAQIEADRKHQERIEAERKMWEEAARKEAERRRAFANELAQKRENQENSNIMLPTADISDSIDLSKLKFSEGLAYFQENGLYGYVDTQGKIVIPVQFKGAGGFYNQRAVVKDHNDLWGYIDPKGNWIVQPQFCMAGKFSEELAGVYIGGYKSGDDCFEGKWGFINSNGQLIIPAQFDRAWAFDKGKAKVVYGEHTGYINKKGEWIN